MSAASMWRVAAVVILAVVVVYALLAEAFTTPQENVAEAWTCLGVAGAVVTGMNLWDSVHDCFALGAMGRNGDLRLIARQALRQDGLRLLQMLAIITTGIVSLSAQPVISAEQRRALHIPVWTPTSIAITGGIVLVVVVAVLQAILDRRARLILYQRHGVV